MNWTEEQYQEFLKRQGKSVLVQDKPKKKGKYNAKITHIDGICFRSQKEANYYIELKLRLQAGDIKAFCLQPKFVLVEGNEQDQAITYSADFIVFNNDGTADIVDTKGYESAAWERTYKMFRLKYPNIELQVVK